MADIRFECPACDQHLEAPMDMAGQDVECPSCQQLFVLPSPPRPSGSPKKKIVIHKTSSTSSSQSRAKLPTTSDGEPQYSFFQKFVAVIAFTLVMGGVVVVYEYIVSDQPGENVATAPDSGPVTFADAIIASSVSEEDKLATAYWVADMGLMSEKLEHHPISAEQVMIVLKLEWKFR
jgi:hypothetical protein